MAALFPLMYFRGRRRVFASAPAWAVGLWLAVGLPVLAIVAWIKFSFLPLAVLGVGGAVITAWARRGAVHASAIAFCFAVALGGAWWASGQALEHLLGYFRSSLWIASGYDEGMALEGQGVEIALGVVLLALSGVLIGRAALAEPRGLGRTLVAVASAVVLLDMVTLRSGSRTASGRE